MSRRFSHVIQRKLTVNARTHRNKVVPCRMPAFVIEKDDLSLVDGLPKIY
jgi:hypothetical protein